jgi:UDPglucose 6-dehydrogenase
MKVGSGYIGLGTGAYFSELGNDVMRFDITSNDINNPKKVIRPIYEPSRKEIITLNTKKERLHFITNIKEVSQESEVLFICLGNSSNENGSPNLKYVLAVAKYYGKQINDYLLVVTKSTVPIATSKKVKKATQDDLDKRDVKYYGCRIKLRISKRKSCYC